MKEGLIKDTYDLVIKEIQTLITLFYIIAVGIGMLFNYQKFSEFGINIFEYADIFDFLIAPFSDAYILFFSIISILLIVIPFKIDEFLQKKWPNLYSKANFGYDKKAWFKLYKLILFFIIFILYLYVSADYYGRFTRNRIMNQGDISIRLVDNEIKGGKLIGKSMNVIFLIHNMSVYAIPINSLVKEIRIK